VCKMDSGNTNGEEAGHPNITVKLSQSGKDFILEVCRESLSNRCVRLESQCRFAHPTPNVQVVDGKVQCCADFMKVTDDQHIITIL